MVEPAREPVADCGARCQIDAVGAIPRSCRNVYIVFCRGHLPRGSRGDRDVALCLSLENCQKNIDAGRGMPV